jgi:hypothetical protein
MTLPNVNQIMKLLGNEDKLIVHYLTTILKNIWHTMCRQMAFNLSQGAKILGTVYVRGKVCLENRGQIKNY